MNRAKALLIIALFALIFIAFFELNLKWECVFKKFIYIACPGCGLTRSLRAIFSFDLIASIKYNILGIPVFLIVLSTMIMALKDFIKNEDTLTASVYKITKKHYKFIFIMLIVTMIINNINGV